MKVITIVVPLISKYRGYHDLFWLPTILEQGQVEKTCLSGGGGGGVAQSVERATPGEKVPGSITAAAARSLLVGSVSV